MKQGALVRGRRRVLDDQRAGGERGAKPGLVKRMGGNDARPGRRRPDRRQMGFAGALGPDQGDGIGRPIRPGIDQRQRVFIAGSGEKILARVAFGVIERERELTRDGGHRT